MQAAAGIGERGGEARRGGVAWALQARLGQD